MPQFTPIPLNFEYEPVPLEQLMTPLALYKQEYDKKIADIDTRRDGIAAFAPYINEGTPEAKALYDNLEAQIERNADYIGTPGYLLHEKPIRDLKAVYGKTTSNLTNAVKNLEARKAETQQEASKHPGLVYNYRDAEGNIIDTPNIDHFLNNGNINFYSVDTDDMMNKAMARAKSLSSRLAASFPGSRIDKTTGIITTSQKDENGAPVSLRLAWFLHPKQYQKEIAEFKRKYKGEEYQQLFNSSVADDIAALYASTNYRNLDVANKAKVDEAIEFGFNTGLGPYQLTRRYNLSGGHTPSASGGGDEVLTPIEPSTVTGRTVVYQTDQAGQDSEERYKNVLNYLGVDDTDYWNVNGEQNEGFDIPLRLGLLKGYREYGEGYDFKDVDSVVNGDMFDMLQGKGFENYYSLFNDDGSFINREDFIAKYTPTFADVFNKAYAEKMNGVSEISDLYDRHFKPEWTLFFGDDFNEPYNSDGSRSAEALKRGKEIAAEAYQENITKAMLDLYEVPEAEREDILDDETGEKFDNWAKKQGITREGVKMRVLELEDKFANTKMLHQTIEFSGDADEAFQKVMRNNVIGEGENSGKITLKPIEKFVFSVDRDGAKRYKAVTGEAVTMTKNELLKKGTDSEGNNYGNSQGWKPIFALPANIDDGLIVECGGTQYLIPKENVSDLMRGREEEIKMMNEDMETLRKYDRENHLIECIMRKLVTGQAFNEKEKRLWERYTSQDQNLLVKEDGSDASMEDVKGKLVDIFMGNMLKKRKTQDLILRSRMNLANELKHDLSVTQKEVKE